MPRPVLIANRRPASGVAPPPVAEGVITAYDTFISPTTNGSNSVLNFSGWGFSSSQPLRGLLLWSSGIASSGVSAGPGQWSQGFISNDGGVIQQAFGFSNDMDGVDLTQQQRGLGTSACLRNMIDDTNVDFIASCTGFTSNTITINWSDAPASARIINCWAFGGSSIAAARVFADDVASGGAAVNIPVNAGWGQADLVFIFNVNAGHNTLSELVTSHGGWNFSAFADPSNQQSAVIHYVDAVGNSNLAVAQGPRALMAVGSIANPTQLDSNLVVAARTAYPADGFRLETAAGATNPTVTTDFIGMAVRGEFTSSIGSIDSRTIAGNTDIVFGGTPKGALFWGANQAESVVPIITASNMAAYFLGAYDTLAQGNAGVSQVDGSDISTAGRWQSQSRAIQEYAPGATPTLLGESVVSVVGSNVRTAWSDPDTSAKHINYLVIG
jgi:hypothetical protein